MRNRRFKHTVLAAAAALALATACPAAGWAAPEDYGTMEADQTGTLMSGTFTLKELPAALTGETEVEKLTIAYKKAETEVAVAHERVAELQVQIDALEAVLPGQQSRSDAAMRQRYIMQSNPMVIADSLLESKSLDSFLKQVEYLEHISKATLEELNRTISMKEELDETKAEQAEVEAEAQEKADEVEKQLKAEQDERARKQAEGISDAYHQANTKGGAASAGVPAPGEKEDENYHTAASDDTGPLDDEADWHADRDEFIAEWADRLDDYLAGTPLEGQGVNFAASAWKYCIDPRFSAAISNTESGRGRVCIRPHNAWGWGAADSDPRGLAKEWDSWEEAIDAHAAGLARGYGYTISISNAQKYCPVGWQDWYNNTLHEMARI